MAITLETVARNAVVNSIGGAVDNGTLQFQTSGGTMVATCAFGSDAFPSASNGSATANALIDDTNALGGTIAKAVFKASGGTAWLTCSVTATGGGGDITMTSVTVAAGDTVHVTVLTLSCPAS